MTWSSVYETHVTEEKREILQNLWTRNKPTKHFKKDFIMEFIRENKTYVHGIVKNIWSGTFSASATWVCPDQVVAHSNILLMTSNYIKNLSPWDQNKQKNKL